MKLELLYLFYLLRYFDFNLCFSGPHNSYSQELKVSVFCISSKLQLSSSPIQLPVMSVDQRKTSTVDPAAVIDYVNQYLSGEEGFERLVARFTEELPGVVESAVTTAMGPVREEMAKLRGEVSSLLWAKLHTLEEKLAYRTDDLEQYQHRNNLRIFGLKEANTYAILSKLCRETLGGGAA